MRWWPRSRRRRPCGRPSEEAVAALEQAERTLIDAEKRDRAAEHVAERLDAIHRRNGFGEGLERIARRRTA